MLVEVGDNKLALNVNHISSVEFFLDENPDPKGRMKVLMSNGDVYDLPGSDWDEIIKMSDAIDLNSVNLCLEEIKDALNNVACCLPDL
jgi:hypothetical protein